MKYTQEEIDYIVNNYATLKAEDIANVLGKTLRSVRSKISRMQNDGIIKIKLGKHEYNKKEDLYICENYYEMTVPEIANTLHVSKTSLAERAQYLQDRGIVFMHQNKYNFVEREKTRITDGYPDVPWWMRQSTRNQFLHINMYYDYA